MMKALNRSFVVAVAASVLMVGGFGCMSEDVDGEEDNQQNVDEQDVEDHDADAGEPEDVQEDVSEDADADTNGEDPFPDAGVEPVECAYPADDPECPQGDWGPASFFSEFEIATDGSNPCCFDLEGDSDDPDDFDNFVGEAVIPGVEAAGIEGMDDINGNIQDSLEAGNLTYVLEADRWEHPEWEPAFNLQIYRGGDTDSIQDALDGDGVFRVDPEQVDENDEAVYGFEHAEVRDGQMEGYNGTIEIGLPDIVDDLGVLMKEVRLSGEVVMNPEPDLTAYGDFALQNGELGGVIMRDDFYKSMNQVAHDCECIDDSDYEDPDNPDPWTEGVFKFQQDDKDDVGDWECLSGKVGEDQCDDDPNPACRTIGYEQFCSTLGLFSTGYDMEDIGEDGDVGYSVGIRFRTVSTTIDGVDD